jgi:hypothetical protein
MMKGVYQVGKSSGCGAFSAGSEWNKKLRIEWWLLLLPVISEEYHLIPS